MPANLVGPGEEKYWSRAKVYCKAKGYKVGSDRYWECVGGTFQRIMRNVRKSRGTKKPKRAKLSDALKKR